MSYDVEFVQIPLGPEMKPPVAAETLLDEAMPFDDAGAIRTMLIEMDGCKPGPDDSIDFMGRGLNYARFKFNPKAIYVENNCGAPELLKIYEQLLERFPTLLIHDLQSGKLHNTESFRQWWQRPL